jgi:hypothetical protein
MLRNIVVIITITTSYNSQNDLLKAMVLLIDDGVRIGVHNIAPCFVIECKALKMVIWSR